MRENNLSLKRYLDLSNLLDGYRGDHESNRLFALKHKELLKEPKEMLLAWLDDNIYRVDSELKSQSYMVYLSATTTLLAFFAIVMGLLVGFGLLSYSGHEPVNIIYYLLMAIAIPTLSMIFSTISMFNSGSIGTFFTRMFPLHWLERIFTLIPFKSRDDFSDCRLSLGLAKWLFLQRVQLFSLLFSIAMLLALGLLVVAKDIAFGWSTTLQIEPSSFHALLKSIGFLWRESFPNAIPSLELVEISQYFRLGEKINSDMIQNADKLGAWWQFLAMTTMVYAILLRFLLWIVTKIIFRQQLEKEFFAINGVDRVLREFATPFVSTKAPKKERHLEIKKESKEQISYSVDIQNSYIIGWNYTADELRLIADSKEIKNSSIESVGGKNSFSDDEAVADMAKGEILLFVKAWEPPTMDFIDLLELLIENPKVIEIKLYPLGTPEHKYQSHNREIAIWIRKIESLKFKKVLIIDEKQ